MIDLSRSSRLLKALGDETRLRLLNLLSRSELSVTDLMEVLNMGQSRISTHLNLMKEVGLVCDRRGGRHNFYSLCPAAETGVAEQVLEETRETPEFAADLSGLETLLMRRRADSRSYFDRVAASFGEQVLPGRTWEGLTRALLRLVPRARYVDLGIGDGLLTMMLAEIAQSVTAVDMSQEMLVQLAQRAKSKGLENIRTVEGEIEDLPLPDESFDIAVLSQALHHADVPERALSEAVRILVPGGRLLVIDLLAHTEDWVREKLQHRQLGFTETRLEQLLAGAGLERVSIQRAARDPQPPHFMTLVATGNRALRPAELAL